MVEPADARELIGEAIEQAERTDGAKWQTEKRFRDGVSLLVGLFAVLLAVIHVQAASNAREGILKTVKASDAYNYMQAKIIRETVVKAAAANPSYDAGARADMLKEARHLRNPDAAGHGIGQLQRTADQLRDQGESASRKGEWYDLAETALQISIVLLSVALVARSGVIVAGALAFALAGALLSAATAAGLLL